MVRATVRTRVHSFNADGEFRARADYLAGEEPLEIRLNGEEFTVAMRTPGADVDLVFGLLLAEGIITRGEDITEIDFSTGLDPDGRRNYNVARVSLAPAASARGELRATRTLYTSSACGICGTSAIEGIEKASAHPVPPEAPLTTPALLLALPDALREHQTAFDRTGGIHAAALFRIHPGSEAPGAETAASNAAGLSASGARASGSGSLGPGASQLSASGAVGEEAAPWAQIIAMAEDVGRHNAVDKVIGRALQENLLPLGDVVLQVSSRASYELVQKAQMAGIPMLSAVSAPSSAAAELGREAGITVVGFNRGTTCNAYSAPSRISASIS